MSESIARALNAAVDNEAPREDRARKAAALIRGAGDYRWVGIYDVGDGEIELIGESGLTAFEEAVRMQTTVVNKAAAIVPILGAESAIIIGTLEIEGGSNDPFSDDDVRFLEDCAAALRPLYD